MKKIIIMLLVGVFTFTNCKKKPKEIHETFNTSGATVIARGTLESAAHTTKGCVVLYAKGDAKIITLQGFETEKGPDLKVYLSKTFTIDGAIKINNLKAIKGDHVYIVNADVTDFKNLLIWCEDFSVLFGSAVLK